jgi:hypothetical protein
VRDMFNRAHPVRVSSRAESRDHLAIELLPGNRMPVAPHLVILRPQPRARSRFSPAARPGTPREAVLVVYAVGRAHPLHTLVTVHSCEGCHFEYLKPWVAK